MSYASYWAVDASGAWTTAADWTTYVPNSSPPAGYQPWQPVVPGLDDDVNLTPTDPITSTALGTTAFIVTYDTTDTINSLTAPAYATLAISGGALSVVGATSFAGLINVTGGGFVQNGSTGESTIGQLDVASPGTVTVDTGSLAVDGAAQLSGVVNGSGSLLIEGSATDAGLTIGGSLTLQVDGTVTQTGGAFALGDSSASTASMTITVDGVYEITDGSAIDAASTQTLITNAGSLEKTAVDDVSYVYADIDDTGTLSVATGNLRFVGATNSFSGTYVGGGMIDYGLGSTSTLGTINAIDGACSTNFGIVNQGGEVTVGNWSTITNLVGSRWSFTADVGLALSEGDTTPKITNHGTLAKTGGTGTSTIAMIVVDDGTINVETGTIAFGGLTSSFAGLVEGEGAVSFTGGTISLLSGADFMVSALSITGGATQVAIDASLAYGGKLTEGAGATLYLTTDDALTLSGAATLSGSVIGGGGLILDGGTLALSGADTFGGGVTIDAGALTLGASTAAGSGPVAFAASADATLNLDAGVAFTNALTGFGAGDSIDLHGASSLTLSGRESGGAIDFASSGGEILLGAGSTPGATIGGFGVGDSVGFQGVAYASGDYATFQGNGLDTGGTVTIDTLAGAPVASFAVSGHYNATQFVVSAGMDGALLVSGAPGHPLAQPDDFNGDGTSDLLWGQSGAGPFVDEAVVDGAVTASHSLRSVAAGWSYAGSGDFNGDGTSDILFECANGATLYWPLSNGADSTQYGLGKAPSGFSIAGAGDFNGDGTSDLLLDNATTGVVEDWIIRNNAVASTNAIGTMTSGWAIIGTGDFNDDGVTDVLMQNSGTKMIADWELSNGKLLASHNVAAPGAGWTYVATGDFNGDGTTDLLFEYANGVLDDWQMKNGVSIASHLLLAIPSGYSVVGTGDFTGNGVSDILIGNAAGAAEVGILSGGAIAKWTPIGSAPGAGWKLIA